MINLNLNQNKINFTDVKFYNKPNSNIIKSSLIGNIETIDYSIDPTVKEDTIVKNKTVKPFIKEGKATIVHLATSSAINSAFVSANHNVGTVNPASFSGTIVGSFLGVVSKIRQLKYSTDFADYAESL